MNKDQNEINKFNELAHEWWNLDGEFRTLHQINPTRLNFIQSHIDINNKKILDVGCGGGILSEAMAKQGAQVTGIDLAPQSIEIAKLHLYESNLSIDYQCIEIEAFASLNSEQYDVITCMEMLEHVPNPELIIKHCYSILKPGGYAFFSTLNRNIASYALGVIAAEYILKLVPRGTHEYKKFIKPSELRQMLSHNNFEIHKIKGISYNPITNSASLTNNTSINYIISCKKPC